MSFVAVAIGGSALIGAGASIIAGNKSSKAIQSQANADAQRQAAQDAESRRRYDMERADLAPWLNAGGPAITRLGEGTAPGGEFDRSFTLADFNKDPGYDFRQQEGQRGVEASASARGGLLSGGTLKALDRYNQDFASNEYGAAYNRFNTDMNTRFNRLASVAGVGQTAVNSGIAAGENLTGNLQTGVNNLNASGDSAANARASSYINTGNAITGAAGQIGNYFALRDLYKSPSMISPATNAYGIANAGDIY